jgi:hypothetical protein
MDTIFIYQFNLYYSKSSSSTSNRCWIVFSSDFFCGASSSTIFNIFVLWEFLFAHFRTSIKLIMIQMRSNINIRYPHNVKEALCVMLHNIRKVSKIHMKALAITHKNRKFNIGSLSLNPRKFTTNHLKRVFIFHQSKNKMLENTTIIVGKNVFPINQNNSFP